MKRGTIREKINEAQRQEILLVYKAEGSDAAMALCKSLNLSPRYYSALASARGVANRKSRPLTAEEKAIMRSIVPMDDSTDPRWQWAVERGPVLAP